jgi:hypothetical protein
MDPVSLIVAALAAGAGAAGTGAAAGVADAAKDAVRALYEQLKGAISRKAEQVPGAEPTLERHASDPSGYEAPVRDLVKDSGAAQDERIVALAEQLLAAVEAAGAGSTAYTVDMHAKATDHGRVYQAGRDQHIRER